MSLNYREEKHKIDISITREWLELSILGENMTMIAVMFATGVPLWLVGLQTIGTLALGGTMVKRYNDGNTAFDALQSLDSKAHR